MSFCICDVCRRACFVYRRLHGRKGRCELVYKTKRGEMEGEGAGESKRGDVQRPMRSSFPPRPRPPSSDSKGPLSQVQLASFSLRRRITL